MKRKRVVELDTGLDALFSSWSNDLAIRYRKINNIQSLKDTAAAALASSIPRSARCRARRV